MKPIRTLLFWLTQPFRRKPRVHVCRLSKAQTYVLPLPIYMDSGRYESPPVDSTHIKQSEQYDENARACAGYIKKTLP